MAVTYNTKNHWSVLTQTHGSQWRQIVPFCVANVILMIVITIFFNVYHMNHFELSNQGHTFLTLVVSFLLVTRVNMALNRYNEARSCIGKMFSELREMTTHICIYTSTLTNLQDAQWRHEVTYRALILLKLIMTLIDYPESKINLWTIPELNGIELQYVRSCIMMENYVDDDNANEIDGNNSGNNLDGDLLKMNAAAAAPETPSPNTNTNRIMHVHKYCHKRRTEWDENLRVPVRIAYLLRQSIHSQSKQLSNGNQVPVLMENRIMTNVDNFMVGYYGIRKFLTTPVPFPLVQMARTVLFLYVFTIPFVFLSDKTNNSLFLHCFAVFAITYGFVGLETVAIELDNPFGNDDNDFDNDGMAEKAYEDVYLTILNIDGPEWATKLRLRMHPHYDNSKPITEQSYLLDNVV